MAKAWDLEELYKWKFSLLMPVIAVLGYFCWSLANSTFWLLVELAMTLWVPILMFYFVSTSSWAQEKPTHMVTPGPLSWIPSMKVRYFVVMVVLPCTAFFDWQMKKRTWARMGPATNATIAAGITSKDFIKSMLSFVLLPVVSMVSHAYQSGQPGKLMQLVGAGLSIALAAGLLGQAIIMVSAERIMGLFEGKQPLLPNSSSLLRLYSASFPFVLLTETFCAILAGTNQHLLIGETVCPVRVLSMFNTCLFLWDTVQIEGHLVIQTFTETLTTFLMGQLVVATLRRTWKEKKAAEDGLAEPLTSSNGSEGATSEAATTKAEAGPSFRTMLADLLPTRQVFQDMVHASANTFFRNLALRLKGFVTGISATRLGNLEGSAWSIQGMLTAYLAGPAGSTGLFTANVAPMLLSIDALGFFAMSTKAIFWLLAFASGLWLYFAAWSGPMSVLRYSGVIPANVTNAMLDLSSTLNATLDLGNATAAMNLTENLTEGQVVGLAYLGGVVQDYLGVMTPLNHWLWAWGTIANEVAAPFDGIIMVLGGYDYMGFIYSGDLFLVLLPALFASHLASKRGECVLPSFLSLSGCNSYTGVRVAELLWGVTRVIGLLWAVFMYELSKIRRRQRYHEAACCREVLEGYMRERCEATAEEVEAMKEKRRGSFFYRFQNDAPMGIYARQHGTSSEVMTRQFKHLCETDGEFKAASAQFWNLYGDWM